MIENYGARPVGDLRRQLDSAIDRPGVKNERLGLEFARIVYDGQWFTPMREALSACCEQLAERLALRDDVDPARLRDGLDRLFERPDRQRLAAARAVITAKPAVGPTLPL